MDGNRSITLTAHDDGTVTAENRHGAAVTVDGKGERGFTPLELFLASLGSCSAVDFVELMRKQRAPVTPLAVTVEGQKEDQRMLWLRVSYLVDTDVVEAKAQRALTKTEGLCTVSRTLTNGSPVEHTLA